MISASVAQADTSRLGLAGPLLPKLAPGVFLLLWSAGFIFGKIGVQYAQPLTLLTARYGLVLLILAPLFLLVRPPLPARPMDWVHVCVAGLLFQGGYFSFLYAALGVGASAGTVALIASLNPIFVAILAPWAAGERRVSWVRWGGLTLGLLGAGLVIMAKSSVEATSLPGLLLAAASVACMTAGTLWEKRFGKPHHPLTSNLMQYCAGFAVCAPLAFSLEDTRIEWTGGLMIALAYLVLANSLFAMSILFAMLRRGEASKVSALFFLVPPTAAFMAWIALGEAMPAAGWAGMALAALGVALAVRERGSSLV